MIAALEGICVVRFTSHFYQWKSNHGEILLNLFVQIALFVKHVFQSAPPIRLLVDAAEILNACDASKSRRIQSLDARKCRQYTHGHACVAVSAISRATGLSF
jgi:hypothetical protein